MGAARRRLRLRGKRSEAPSRPRRHGAVVAPRTHRGTASRRGRRLLPQRVVAGSAGVHPLAHGRGAGRASARDGQLGGSGAVDGRRTLRRQREDAGRVLRVGRRLGGKELPAEAAGEAHQAALVPASEGPRLMAAEEKEAFLSRWSRLKREAPAEEKALEEKEVEAQPAPALPPVETLTPESDFAGF